MYFLNRFKELYTTADNMQVYKGLKHKNKITTHFLVAYNPLGPIFIFNFNPKEFKLTLTTSQKCKVKIKGDGSSGETWCPTPVQRCRLSTNGRVTVVQPGMLDILQETDKRSSSPKPNLSTIVADYLKNQHSQCKNPVVTVPEFSLLR